MNSKNTNTINLVIAQKIRVFNQMEILKLLRMEY